ncbi:MAG: hypothetical protein ACYTGH_05575, partial [Planctomycetota bacterium]
KEREKFFTEGAEIGFLCREYERSNRMLERELARLDKELSRPFSEKLLPKEEEGHRQAFVRESLNHLQNRLQQSADSRSIHLSEQAQTLGLVLPEEYTEDLQTDLGWLAQMRVTWELLELLMKHSEQEGHHGMVRHILGIYTIQPRAAVQTGPEPHFLQEIPVHLELDISLQGIMRMLEIFARPETYHRVLSVKLSAAPSSRKALTRQTKPVVKGDKREQTRWAQHYYRVDLRISRVESFKPAASAEAAKKPEAPKVQPRAIAF